MFKIDQNDQSSMLFEKILKITGVSRPIQMSSDVYNIYTCYPIKNLCHIGGFENKYKNMFDNLNSDYTKELKISVDQTNQ